MGLFVRTSVDPMRVSFVSANPLTAFVMSPTLENVKGHIAFCLSLRPCVRLLQNLLRYSFEISYMDPSSNNN